MMGLRGDYFHTGRDLYLAKRLLNQLKLTTGKSLWPQKITRQQCQSNVCNSLRIIFPVLVLGKSSTNCTARGTL